MPPRSSALRDLVTILIFGLLTHAFEVTSWLFQYQLPVQFVVPSGYFTQQVNRRVAKLQLKMQWELSLSAVNLLS